MALAMSSAYAAEPYKYGHSTYTYGPLHCTQHACDVVPSCNRAHWASDIAAFNQKCNDKTEGQLDHLNIVYSYGGDIEFWPGKDTPTACHAPASTDLSKCNVSVFFDVNNQAAAQVYKKTDGVEHIIALLDSRMDGWAQIEAYNDYDGCKFGDFYPNLGNLTDMSIDLLAKDTAELYCAVDIVDGVQVDLEPYREPYKTPLRKFLTKVREYMYDENKTTGCRTDTHPKGRSVSYFTFAHNHATDFVTEVLGDNGYFVFSAYDLFPKDLAFTYNNVTEFKNNLIKEITYMRPALSGPDGTTKGKFTLALPFGASCHEYEQYVPMKGDGCGPACEGLTNPAQMHQYVQAAFDVLLDPETTKATNGLFCLNEKIDTQFLGISWWSFSYQMTYPPMKWFDNEFLPGTPTAAALDIVAKQLPGLTDGTTCTAAQKKAMGLI
jgi:hypothetical protein